MNIDDLKDEYQSLSYKGEKDKIEFHHQLENTIERIKREDRKEGFTILGAIFFVIGVGLIYGIWGFLKYIDNPKGGYWGFVLYDIALLVILPFIIYKYQRYRNIRYDIPINRFIESAEKRYRLFHLNQLCLIPFFVILDISLIYMLAEGKTPDLRLVLYAQMVMIIVVTVGFLGVLIKWNKKSNILEELRRIKQSLKE